MTGAPRPAGQLRVGLTGGIGSGKSSVADVFAGQGAVVIDADQLAREALAPGSDGLGAVVDRFGAGLLRPDRSLDRSALAAVVFADESARVALNAIVHPRVGERSAELMAAAGPGTIVVYDVPLLVETARQDEFDAVVVVTAPIEARIARLADRGVPEADARARIAAQVSDDQRREIAWAVIDNGGSREQLADATRRVWQRLLDLQRSRPSV
ncbi:MAG: dephospho-CoA kinase [Jatrophihabitans sp.]